MTSSAVITPVLDLLAAYAAEVSAQLRARRIDHAYTVSDWQASFEIDVTFAAVEINPVYWPTEAHLRWEPCHGWAITGPDGPCAVHHDLAVSVFAHPATVAGLTAQLLSTGTGHYQPVATWERARDLANALAAWGRERPGRDQANAGARP